jgi:hypothetical protein
MIRSLAIVTALVLLFGAIAHAPPAAAQNRQAVVTATGYAMEHARQTGTTVYGVSATTIDFSRDGHPELFGLYSLNNQFSIPVGAYMVYFRGVPGGFEPQVRVELAGVSPRVQGHELNQIFIASETPQGTVVQGFQWTPNGLIALD